MKRLRCMLLFALVAFTVCDVASCLNEGSVGVPRIGWLPVDLAFPEFEFSDQHLFEEIFPRNDGLWKIYNNHKPPKPRIDMKYSLAFRGSCAADIGRCAVIDPSGSSSEALGRAIACYVRAVHTGNHSAQCLSVALMGLARHLIRKCVAGDMEACSSVQHLVRASSALFQASNTSPSPISRAPITARVALSAALFHHVAMVKGSPVGGQEEGKRFVVDFVRAGLLATDAANPREAVIYYGLEMSVVEDMRRTVAVCANSASSLMALLGHEELARKGLCSDICEQDGTLAVYMIASASPDTLDNSLPSYLASGLLNCAVEARIVFQDHERWMSDLAHMYGMKAYGAEGVSRGIGESWHGQLLLKGVDLINEQQTGSSRFVLLLEEDFAASEESHPHVKRRLEDAMSLLRSGRSNAVRLRHTKMDGWPNYSKLHYERYGSIPKTKLLDSVYWANVDTIERTSDVRRCGANDDFVCVGSHQGEYTNNPSLYEREWLMKTLGNEMKNSKGVSLEDNVNAWWTTREGITTAQHRVGIFTHHRRDRPLGEILQKYPDLIDHLIQWARGLLQVDQTTVKAVHIAMIQMEGDEQSDNVQLTEQKVFAVKIDGELSYDYFIQQLILEMHKLILIKPNMKVRLNVLSDPAGLVPPLVVELQLPGVI